MAEHIPTACGSPVCIEVEDDTFGKKLAGHASQRSRFGS